MLRLILFFVAVIPCAGFSALQWLKRYIFNHWTMNAQDRDRVSDFYGILSPEPALVEAWRELFHNGRPDGADRFSFELFKNVEAEWSKLDPHRATFFLCLIICFWLLVALLEAIALALVVFL